MTELGNRLREAREAKNLSLDDLQALTKIQKRYLIGIEEGNYKIMPGKFYVRAFIKQYAEAVGLDPDQIFEDYKSEIPASYNDELPENLSRVTSRKQIASSGSKVLEFVPRILLIAFIMGAAIAVWIFMQNREPEKDNDSAIEAPTQVEQGDEPEEETETAGKEDEAKEKNADEKADADDEAEEAPAEDEAAQEVSVVQQSGYTSVLELKNTDKFVIDLSSTGDTWIGVSNGKGNTFLQKLMKSGENQTLDVSKETEVLFNIGNTLNTEIKVNGQKLEYPINPNDQVRQKVTIRFTPSETAGQ